MEAKINYLPVITYNEKLELDRMLRPLLPKVAHGVMVSYLYARNITPENQVPLPHHIDSGGFAAIYPHNLLVEEQGLGVLHLGERGTLHPRKVLDLQERLADVAFTLDFIIPPGTTEREAGKRYELAHHNALWALENRERKDMKLYACVQIHHLKTMVKRIEEYDALPFDGIALGGLVPYATHIPTLLEVVKEALQHTQKPLHVFGIGDPGNVKRLEGLGVHSVDSSYYVKASLSCNLWGQRRYKITPTTQLNVALLNLQQVTGKVLPESATEGMLRYLERAA